MGADTFFDLARGETAKGAFSSATEQARYESGHGGYTGTIAEKREFTMIYTPTGVRRPGADLPTVEEATQFAEQLIEKRDRRIDDKWGPAGCIECVPRVCPIGMGSRLFLFFGWASS